MKIKRYCQICNKVIYVFPHRIKLGKGKYCSRECYGKARQGKPRSKEVKQKIGDANRGSNHGMWKGGRSKTYYGYVMIYAPNHPYKSSNRGLGYVLEHRLAMEKHLGRYLLPKERVHHLNGIKDDNRVKNLKLFSSEIEHQKFHYNLKGKARFYSNMRI